MSLLTISAKNAIALDQELMGPGGFSIDQLMELAGMAVAHAVYKLHPPEKGRNILIACGPGNNGGDGLVAARHLHHLSYTPTIYYPKQPSKPLFGSLVTQLRSLSIPFTDDFAGALSHSDHVLDALFGFSFTPPIREPFPGVIRMLAETAVPVTAVDVPSGWDVGRGMPEEGPARGYVPGALVSLTAPKECARGWKGRHFVGGRFVGRAVAERWGVMVPEYRGVEQVVEVDVDGKRVD